MRSAPAAVSLTAPADGAYVPGTIVQLRWDPAARANDYYVEMATDAGFTNRVFAQWISNYVGLDLTGRR